MILGDNINGRSREIEVEKLSKWEKSKKATTTITDRNTLRTLLHHFSHFTDNSTYFELLDSEYNVVDDDN